MYHERKVGTNVSNPHSATTYIMLNSILLTMSFKNALDAYHCLKVVNSLSFPKLVKAFYSPGSFPHVVIIRIQRKGSILVDQIDIHIMADYCQPRDYYWTTSLESEEDIVAHKKSYSI